MCPALTVSLHFITTCATRIDCFVCAGDFSIDTLKKEAESLMIPGEKWPDYIGAQILRFKEEELKLERKEAEKQLELEPIKMNITKTGLLWKLKTRSQRTHWSCFFSTVEKGCSDSLRTKSHRSNRKTSDSPHP